MTEPRRILKAEDFAPYTPDFLLMFGCDEMAAFMRDEKLGSDNYNAFKQAYPDIEAKMRTFATEYTSLTSKKNSFIGEESCQLWGSDIVEYLEDPAYQAIEVDIAKLKEEFHPSLEEIHTAYLFFASRGIPNTKLIGTAYRKTVPHSPL